MPVIFPAHHRLGADKARGDGGGGCASKPQSEGSALIRRSKVGDTLAAGEGGSRAQSGAELRFNRKSEGMKKIKNKNKVWCGGALETRKKIILGLKKKSLPTREKMNATSKNINSSRKVFIKYLGRGGALGII